MRRKPLWIRLLSAALAPLILLQSAGASFAALPGSEQDAAAERFAGNPLPVHLKTGEVLLKTEDLAVGIDALPLAVGRVYRSGFERDKPGVFGHKWHSILDMQVSQEGTRVSLHDEDGRLREYAPQSAGLWTSLKFEYEELRQGADQRWERQLTSGTVYHFDTEGRLAEITEPNGRFIRITRLEGAAGSDGRSIRLDDRYGRSITLTLDAKGRAIAAQDSTGRRCAYQYDEQDNLTTTINHFGGTLTMTYDAEHRLAGLEGALKYAVAYKDGRIAEQRMAGGVIASYDYTADKEGNIVCRATDAAGGVSRVTFAANGHVQATDPTGVQESIWLNDRELPVKAVGANGQTVEVRYDKRSAPVEIINNGVATRLTYGADNTLSSVASDTGEALTFTYDQRRNVTGIANQRGARSVFEWDAKGLLRSAKEAAGSSVSLDYDAYGQVNTMRTGDGQTVAMKIDALGLLRELTTPTGVNVQYVYNPSGQLTGVENSEGQRVRLERDVRGQVVRVLDAAGNETRMDYDPSGLLTLVRDPVGAATRLDYDTHGRPKSLTDSNDNVTRWTYDPAGRLLSEVDSLGQPATLVYDQQGQLVEQVNRRGQSTSLSYDDKGNVSRYNLAGSTASFGYDIYGRSVGMSNADSDFAFALTPEGLIERVTDRKAGIEVAYAYDAAGRRTSMKAGDETVRYAYDAHGRLNAIESSAGRVTFEYDAFGRRAAMQYPNGVRTTYRYDKLNQILEIWAVGADGSDISRFRYTYDNLGNRTQMIEGEDRIVNYTYDAASRLVSVTDGAEVTEYVYDGVGNRIAVLVNGEREDYVTGKDNRLLKAGKPEFDYDADGNMTLRTTAEGKRYAYRYDAANRMTEADGPDGKVTYAYAPNGARVSRTEKGQSTRFVFDQEDVVFELVDGKIAARYLHGPGIDEPLSMKRGEDSAFYHADALGSVTRLTGVKGAAVANYRYDAFGDPQTAGSNIINPYRYTAREWDGTASSYFYRARFYLAESGRFSAKDPLGLSQGPNLYAYCDGNPINFIDPSGMINFRMVGLGLVQFGVGIINTSLSVASIAAGCALVAGGFVAAPTGVALLGVPVGIGVVAFGGNSAWEGAGTTITGLGTIWNGLSDKHSFSEDSVPSVIHNGMEVLSLKVGPVRGVLRHFYGEKVGDQLTAGGSLLFSMANLGVDLKLAAKGGIGLVTKTLSKLVAKERYNKVLSIVDEFINYEEAVLLPSQLENDNVEGGEMPPPPGPDDDGQTVIITKPGGNGGKGTTTPDYGRKLEKYGR